MFYAIALALILHGSAVVENRHGRIGIEDSNNPFTHEITIIHVLKDSPASKAGLKRWDKIIYVDDVDILGPAGTEVTLIIKRGNKVFSVTITRQDVNTVDTKHYDPNEDKP